MSNWILYDEFVDLLKKHHRNSFSGLITGVSDAKHSFQMGFDNGEIILMTYRVKKGSVALQYLMQIERAKIIEHGNRDIPDITGEILDTGLILSELTSTTLDQTSTSATDISVFNLPPEVEPLPNATSTLKLKVDDHLRRVIEAAAVRHFGPVGALVCEEQLVNSQRDARTILKRIARDVGASKTEAQAFIDDVSNR